MATPSTGRKKAKTQTGTMPYQVAPLQDYPASEDFLFQNVLPDQFFESALNARAEGPELSLARAVLEDAIYCYQRQFISVSRGAKRHGREAEQWIFSDDTAWAFSFVNLCDALAIDPHAIRRALRRALPQHAGLCLQRKRHVNAPRRTLKIAA